MRCCADTFDLSFADERWVSTGAGFEESKFDARRTDIEGEDVAAHRSPTELEKAAGMIIGLLPRIAA
jgi:hypothetical protein